MRLLIDMDDVLIKGGFLHLINDFLKTDYKEEDFKDFYMQDILPDKDAFFNWFKDKNLYDYSEVLPDAREVLEALNQKYELYICTSYIYKELPNECGHILFQKHEALRKYFPFIDAKQYIFTSNKKMIDADIRIDDLPSNFTSNSRNLLFTAFHNKDISDDDLDLSGIERVNDWLDVAKKLL